jgi:spore maturation protein A
MNVLGNAGFLSIIGKLIEKPLFLIFNKNELTSKDKNNLSVSFAADFLGLGNAALPFGIAAMKSLNKGKEYATDNAIMHAVLNTVPIQLIPSTLIALRSNNGSKDPFDVIPYIWLCSLIITVFAVITCTTLSKLWGKEQNKDG